jgi:hypothetical protein
MDRLITVKDIQHRYGCSHPTACKYMRQVVPHMEHPLTCQEWAFREWEEKRTVIPVPVSRKRRNEILYKAKTGRVHVPRKREG